MRCKHCDYPLWNLRDRQCPECGQAFLPSEFRFALNAVRFACPHCDQGYYGTGTNGHLSPREFSCVGCGNRIDMDAMVLLPTEGVDERLTGADSNPWLDEDAKFSRRWLATLTRGVSSPGWLMRVTPADSDAGRAWGFAILSHVVIGMLIAAPVLALMIVVSIVTGSAGFAGISGAVLVSVLVMAVISIVGLALWVLVTHAVLRLGGRPASGMGRTAQALCYTCAPQLVVLTPCLGPYLGWMGTLWWVIAAGFAVAAGQKVSGTRAAVAVAALPLVVFAIAVAWFVSAFTGAISSSASFKMDGGESVSVFWTPLRTASDTGAWPTNIGELLLDGSLSPYDFTSAVSPTTGSDAILGSVSLGVWDDLSPEQRRRAVGDAAASVGPDAPAYRVGDFVFTYAGIDPASRDTGLWIVVEAWDPGVGGQWQSQVHALTPSGRVNSFSRSMMGPELQAQNALRAGAGLPPLPDPFSVRQGIPAQPESPGPDDPG
ncbi:MAG: hypothetical protein IT431_10065 [Phycisphaerales bacterium]|nr:hypothetical protein [Phycisphaerales bacterium]